MLISQYLSADIRRLIAELRSPRAAVSTLTMFAALSGMLMAFTVAQAAGVTEITCGNGETGFKIFKQGQYRLAQDCVITKGVVGIDITADNVKLDLDGHTISGPGCGKQDTFGISLAHLTNVRVTNGRVTGFVRGIQAVTIERSQFSQLMLVKNCEGIQLTKANENQVSYNVISGNTKRGVRIDSANKNDVTWNKFDGNSSNNDGRGIENALGGVSLGDGANSNLVAFNTFSRNLQSGVILLTLTHNNIVASNIFTKNGAGGARAGGISVFAASTGNFVVNNIALDSIADNDAEDQNPNCEKNTWKDNNFGKTSSTPPSCIK